jgi:hypothetical protein
MQIKFERNQGAWILGLIALFIFSIMLWQKQPDLYDHVLLSKRLIEGDLHYANFLYYLIVAAFAFFQSNLIILQVSALCILSASVIAKYLLAYQYLFGKNLLSHGYLKETYSKSIALLSLGLCLAINFPVNFSATWYLGQFSPNLWHNSTTIFLMPFALLLYFEALQYLRYLNVKSLWMMSIWVLIGALIKPSFLFAFIPAFLILLVKEFKLSPLFFKGLIPLAFSLLGIAWVGIYNFITNTYNEGGGVRIAPFKVWSNWSENISLSILASLAFPLAVLIFNMSKLKVRTDYLFAWILMIPALLVYIFFAEQGANWIVVASNFSWQLIVCNFILFMASLKICLEMDDEKRLWGRSIRSFLLYLFAAHVLFGILYLIKIPIFGYR